MGSLTYRERCDMENKSVVFPTNFISLGMAIDIVKFRLDDTTIPLNTKMLAISRIAEMETINSITKDELQKALRWLFLHYDFER